MKDEISALVLDPGYCLTRAGYAGQGPTLTMTGTTAALAALPATVEVELDASPGHDWSQVFLGEGFDPVDGESRLAILRRAKESVFAAVRADGRIAAVGSAGLAHGWCGIHDVCMSVPTIVNAHGAGQRLLIPVDGI